MRWSAGVFVALIGLVLVAGPACRNIPTENTDRNRAPDTYLSAAPVDSVAGGGLTRIPHRYRAHWSGADIDGEIVGFYVAVTETTVEQTSGRPFRRPPPRPSQYQFTTAKDSLFTFTILEGRGSDREHALYVFAVDNQGKVDPTPAVTHFVARDQNLPEVRFQLAEGRGSFFASLPCGQTGVRDSVFTRALRDTFELPLHAARDTIPSGASVRFVWEGFDRDFGSSISGYLYKLTETEFVRVDRNFTSVDYGDPNGMNPAPLPIGLQTFRIRSIDEAGATTQPDALRRFIVNFSPDTWFSGPNPADPVMLPHLLTDEFGTYFEPLDSVGGVIPFPGNPLTDTLELLPAERPAMDGLRDCATGLIKPKTFVERRTRLDRKIRNYIRSEDDTVAFGSLIQERLGGFDRDSPYVIKGAQAGRVFQSGPPNGSPSTFRAHVVTLFPDGGSEAPPLSTPFPNFDFLDPGRNEAVLFTLDQITATGRGYLQALAVDGDRTLDGRTNDPIRNVAEWEAEGNDAMRSKILTFYTNFNPGLLVPDPRPDSVVNPPANRFNVTVRVTDPDPDVTLAPISGSPYRTMFLTVRARIYTAGDPPPPSVGWQDPVQVRDVPQANSFPYTQPYTLEIIVPDDLPEGRAILEIEVADSSERNKARIINVPIPIYWRTGP